MPHGQTEPRAVKLGRPVTTGRQTNAAICRRRMDRERKRDERAGKDRQEAMLERERQRNHREYIGTLSPGDRADLKIPAQIRLERDLRGMFDRWAKFCGK